MFNVCQRSEDKSHLLERNVRKMYILRNLVLFAFSCQPLENILIGGFSFGQSLKDFFTEAATFFHQPLEEDAIFIFGQTLGHSLKQGGLRWVSSCHIHLIVVKVPWLWDFSHFSGVRNCMTLWGDLIPHGRSLQITLLQLQIRRKKCIKFGILFVLNTQLISTTSYRANIL